MPPVEQNKKLANPSHCEQRKPDDLRGPEILVKRIRYNSHVHSKQQSVNNSPIVKIVNTKDEIEIVHIGRKLANDCAINVSIGNRDQRALWDSGAGRCIVSYECYKRIHPKYKTELKTGKMEYHTLSKKDFPTIQVNEAGPQQDYVHYKKPFLKDAPIDKQTRLDLENLLQENHDAFAEDERQIGTTPLIQMSIDTADHPPIAKKPYALALNHYDWVKRK